ncbi:DUF397 domain-containing protein [Kitasatospora sp. NPDC059827]|uniref:DUF397 domain-containing protein n=1 Tax=Kitasatospora sp. NPDC059827 TaxID=3346964 RepID=UPI00366369EC
MSRLLHHIGTHWEKSSYSGSDGGQCLEFSRTAAAHGLVPVRDSKDPEGPSLLFSTDAWSAFVAELKSGKLSAS